MWTARSSARGLAVGWTSSSVMIFAMNTAKEEVRGLLERLPNDASFEDIQYQVYLLDEVARGAE